MTTRATGVPTATAVLREFLVSHFDLGELEVLCFDLAIDYDVLPHRTRLELADGLIEHCAGLGQLRQLAATALTLRPSVADGPALAAHLDQLPTTPATRVRVQVTLDLDMAAWGDRPMREVVEHIARLGGVARLEIHALAALPGSVRFLIGAPESILPRLLAAPLPQLVSGRWRIIRIEPFYALPLAMQAAWQAEFLSRAPGGDPQQRKLNFPRKGGCAGTVIGLVALIAIIIGLLVISGRAQPGAPPSPAIPLTPTHTPTSIPADKATPAITKLWATPLTAYTNPDCGPTVVYFSATLSTDVGLDKIDVHAVLSANINSAGALAPNGPSQRLEPIPAKLSGENPALYSASVNLANLPATVKSGNATSWTMEYWIVAVDRSGTEVSLKANPAVVVIVRCPTR